MISTPPVPDPESYVEEHRQLSRRLQLRGRVLVGEEGINGTVSGPVRRPLLRVRRTSRRGSEVHRVPPCHQPVRTLRSPQRPLPELRVAALQPAGFPLRSLRKGRRLPLFTVL